MPLNISIFFFFRIKIKIIIAIIEAERSATNILILKNSGKKKIKVINILSKILVLRIN